jgi:hypothetical protein
VIRWGGSVFSGDLGERQAYISSLYEKLARNPPGGGYAFAAHAQSAGK